MDRKVPVLTIGYGNRPISEFLELLKRHGVHYLIDIRTKPFSRVNPDFSKKQLEATLKANDIRYVYMGDELGGLPKNADCYTNGYVDYSKLEQLPAYKRGIARLSVAWEKQIHVAIMCTEGRPEDCHRSKLIGQTLSKLNIQVAHIDIDGNLVPQEEVIYRLTHGQTSLLDEPVFVSRKQYIKQG
ncbi:DUF488 domain-containing protein [Alicyclobacillus shizuokensis]|uniref:DUF488 domain-containing protein n=1 Tax=Alicyclobacillus shizuokensis TaxID=392014 RepID=UPI000833A3E0|nr:DUF488 domain-containing protein [Alicyclobacillus shizuokensis]MCL6626497.1 DUF488 domain-containing protein [Alicyclobacillus shizuokensis]